MNCDVEQYLCMACDNHLILANGIHQNDGNVLEGELVCPTCSTRHPIISGIPRFVPADNYAGSFGYQWNIHCKTQLDSYTGLTISRDRLFSVSGWTEQLVGDRILEAGSGAGRFTEVLLKTGADIYSFDFSSAVEANRSNNGHMENLHLFQGDIYKIPLPQKWFDKIICLGVLQHTPDPEYAFKSLVNHVKPGGELVVDVYNASLLSRIQWKYLLRPVTIRMNKENLYKLVSRFVPILIPFTKLMRKFSGRIGARFSPIVEYSHLNLPPQIIRDWAVLDTFDMYSPAHDHPQSLKTVRKWFSYAGFVDIKVQLGPNGVTGKGKKPLTNLMRP